MPSLKLLDTPDMRSYSKGLCVRTYRGKSLGAKRYCILLLSSKKVGVGAYSVRNTYLVHRLTGLVTLAIL